VPIRTIDRALDCVREAFYVARAERKPVVLSVPLDLQTEEFPYLPDYTPSMDLLPRAQVLRPTLRWSTRSLRWLPRRNGRW
jgi:acetolactate synthase-1/2/3 large subunit